MHQMHGVTLLPQQGADLFGVGDIPGDHQAAGTGMLLLPQLLQPAPRPQQQPQGDAAAVAEADGPPQVAGPPALTVLRRQGGGLAVAAAFAVGGGAAVVHPTVLEAEFQGTHIAGPDQLARLHTEIRHDPLHDLRTLPQPLPAGRAEGQVVGPERRAREPEA